MLRKLNNLVSFTPPAAGARSTINIPVGPTYYGIVLQYTESGTLVTEANMKAAIEEVLIKINGTPVRRLSATDIIALNALHGVAYQDGFLPLYFAEPWARSANSEDFFAWGTLDVQTFQIEVKIASGRTAPALSAVAETTNESRKLNAIKKFNKYNIPVASTGIVNWQNLPRIGTLAALHAVSGDIDDVSVKVDNVEVFDLTVDQINQDLNNYPDITPQTDIVHVLFNKTSRASDNLPFAYEVAKNQVRRVQDFQVDFNMSAANAFDVIAETIGTVN